MDDATSRKIEELARALRRERVHVGELKESLLRQRAAIAASDTDGVNASADEIGRILLALESAKTHRNRLVGEMAGMAPPPLDRLEEILGITLPAQVERERVELRHAARDVAREAAINRSVIGRVVATGEALLQTIFSSGGDPPPVYGPAAPSTGKVEGSGFFCNRRA
jgi:hypothetical protein